MHDVNAIDVDPVQDARATTPAAPSKRKSTSSGDSKAAERRKKARADTSCHPKPTNTAATSATATSGSGPGQRETQSDVVSSPHKDPTSVASASAGIGNNVVAELGPVGGEGDAAAQLGIAPVVPSAAAA